jgi:hypothetical protein
MSVLATGRQRAAEGPLARNGQRALRDGRAAEADETMAGRAAEADETMNAGLLPGVGVCVPREHAQPGRPSRQSRFGNGPGKVTCAVTCAEHT